MSLSPTSLRTRTTCRTCGSQKLAPVLNLGDQYISGAFPEPGGRPLVQRSIPLELVRCDMTADQDACGLVQIRHTVPGSILYQNYWYRSGVNQTMTRNLHSIARGVESLTGLSAGDLVVDIGCNDGTLLDGYETRDVRFLGFDPSDVSLHAVEKGYDVVRDFFGARALRQRYADRRAKVITSIAMFYDLEDPAAFVRDVADSLAEDGVWVMELHYLPLMLQSNAFDVIVHEHLEYYSLAVLERLFAEAGLEVLDGELNEINGGSIRLYIAHAGRREPTAEATERLHDLRIREFEMALDSPAPYEEFARGVERVRDELKALCESIVAEGKTIHVYGASTKGNTILQYADLGPELITHAADRNPAKWGSLTRTDIPVISEEDSRAMSPDYYLVLPWHFLDEFLERERPYLEGGGSFIVPLPEVRVIGAEADARAKTGTLG
ncbi:MAG TPA: class I SAM-dependent methyltransferase [Thermoleophilaceae bacterium]|nr:class I SAM-dependent methyltransferase [Thermoleophilaceae bacterium]